MPEGLGGSTGSAKPHSSLWVVKLGAKRDPELFPGHSMDRRWLGGHRFGDTKLRQRPSTDTRRRFPGIKSSPAYFSAAHTRPSAGDIGVLPLLPHQSPPAPLGTTLRPEKCWHRSPAPARRSRERATMCHNGPIVPRSHRALSHPPRGCPTRSAPSRDPLLPSGGGGGKGGRAPWAPRGVR